MSEMTPMMQQYHSIKAEAPGAILFFRLGDFYEMFGPDAIEASKILDITLTARNKKEDAVPMCGIPYHAAENYIAKLTKAGKKVAICEQVSDASLPGIVKRKIVRVITPGTSLSEQVLSRKNNRYIAALYPQKDYFGLAFADLSTGEFQATELSGKEDLKNEMLRLRPSELVLLRDHYDNPELRPLLAAITDAHLSPCDLYDESFKLLTEHFRVSGLDGFGIGNKPFAIQAAGLLLRYLKDTQKDELPHLDRITSYNKEHWMVLDEATIRNLELFSTLRDHNEEGTLLKVVDHTRTSMGARMLRRWLLRPLLSRQEIEARHEAVEDLVQKPELRHSLQELLKHLGDLERLVARLSTVSGNARDMVGLCESLIVIPELKKEMGRAESRLLISLAAELKPLEGLCLKIRAAFLDAPSPKITEGGMIRPGFNPELDELLTLSKEGKTALKNIEEQESAATGISSLKVGYNKVFGYYLEVSNINLSKVPAHYIRKQTLSNAERFITPELKTFEEKVLSADEKAKALEYEIYQELRALTLDFLGDIKQNAEKLSELDVLLSFADLAVTRNYVRPQLTTEKLFEVEAGRHPVVESITFEESFIPNPTAFGTIEFKLITGPNMSGKSTYLRQVALIALLNQVGSFVPAKSAKLKLFDRIYTRVGASDNLVRGQSTFMVEMQESAYILHHATEHSLVILDEVGRGTSTYDGLSIAWAILEYLHDHVRAFTLFATHYHELIGLVEKCSRAKNYSIEVKETAKGVLFLHQIVEGGIDRSYGIEVAKLAGMPSAVVHRSQEILKELELEKREPRRHAPENQLQLSLQTDRKHQILEKLKGLDINTLTPLDALQALHELKQLKE